MSEHAQREHADDKDNDKAAPGPRGTKTAPGAGATPVGGLLVGSADDPAEAAADAVADAALARIRRRVAGGSARVSLPFGETGGPTPLDRIRRATTAQVGFEGGPLDAATDNRINSLRSSGSPLAPELRSSMESAFGAPLDKLRIHTGGEAASISRQISAKAFTTGNDIFFGEGQFRPDSPEGAHTLAHEIAHTLQPGGGAGRLYDPAPIRRDLQKEWKSSSKRGPLTPRSKLLKQVDAAVARYAAAAAQNASRSALRKSLRGILDALTAWGKIETSQRSAAAKSLAAATRAELDRLAPVQPTVKDTTPDPKALETLAVSSSTEQTPVAEQPAPVEEGPAPDPQPLVVQVTALTQMPEPEVTGSEDGGAGSTSVDAPSTPEVSTPEVPPSGPEVGETPTPETPTPVTPGSGTSTPVTPAPETTAPHTPEPEMQAPSETGPTVSGAPSGEVQPTGPGEQVVGETAVVGPSVAPSTGEKTPETDQEKAARYEEAVLAGKNETHLKVTRDQMLDVLQTLPAPKFAAVAAVLMLNTEGGLVESAEARVEALKILTVQLQDPGIARKLLNEEVAVIVVPRNKKMTDLVEFSSLKGTKTFDGRTWDDVRGSGGFRVPGKKPVYVAVTEENLTGAALEGDVATTAGCYAKGYSTTSHEFAHVIDQRGLTDEDRAIVDDLYKKKHDLDATVPQEWADGFNVETGANTAQTGGEAWAAALPDSTTKAGLVGIFKAVAGGASLNTVTHALAWLPHMITAKMVSPDGTKLLGPTGDEWGTIAADAPKVISFHGGLPVKKVECYASVHRLEYFAQSANAFLGTNTGPDPYTKAGWQAKGTPEKALRRNGKEELKRFDPELVKMFERIFGKDSDLTGANPRKS